MKSSIFLLLVFSVSLSTASNKNDVWQMTKDHFKPSSNQQNKKAQISTPVQGAMKLIGSGLAAYGVISGWKSTYDHTASLASGITNVVKDGESLLKKEMEKQYTEQLNNHISKINEKLEVEREALRKEQNRLKEEEARLINEERRLISDFGTAHVAKNAVESLSYSQLQMLAASEALSGSGKTYFTEKFHKETERLKIQIEKQKTNDVKFVLSNMNSLNVPGNRSSLSPRSSISLDNSNNV